MKLAPSVCRVKNSQMSMSFLSTPKQPGITVLASKMGTQQSPLSWQLCPAASVTETGLRNGSSGCRTHSRFMSLEHEHTILRQIRVKYFVLLAIFILQWSQLRVGRMGALRHRGRLHSTNQMQAGGYPHGHALHNHSLIIACWRGLVHSTIKSGSKGLLKCKCIIRGKHCLLYKTSLSTISQKCTQKAKGGQHLIRHGCPFKWSKWCLFYYHFRFQSMPSRAIQCGLHLEISSLGPLQSTLHRWRTGCVKVKTGSGFYSWWHKPQFESDHCLGTFQGKHFTASPQPKASRAQLQRNSLTFTQPEFLWKWVLTENSHMCYPKTSQDHLRKDAHTGSCMCSVCSHAPCLP